jgi:hypothetical protein
MKRYLICALVAAGLSLNAEAKPDDKDKNKDKDKDKNGPVESVPDNGSTMVLLGTAMLVLVMARRRLATN